MKDKQRKRCHLCKDPLPEESQMRYKVKDVWLCHSCYGFIYDNLCGECHKNDPQSDLEKFQAFLVKMGIEYAFSEWKDGNKRIVPLDKNNDACDAFEFDKDGKLIGCDEEEE